MPRMNAAARAARKAYYAVSDVQLSAALSESVEPSHSAVMSNLKAYAEYKSAVFYAEAYEEV